MLIKVTIKKIAHDCPFDNEFIEFTIDRGQVFWLRGISGSGKTSIANHLAGIYTLRGAKVSVEWGDPTAKEEKNPIGIMFQDGVLIDSLNLVENLILSCKAAGKPCDIERIEENLKAVDLKREDLYKMPNELSGGMKRRAALSQILAQEKKVIILDEPFVGLDTKAVYGVINVMQSLQKKGVTFILISHQENFCEGLVDPGKEVLIEPSRSKPLKKYHKRLPHWNQFYRTLLKIGDYLFVSFPLIVCAFVAAGFATSMLFAQMLRDTDIKSLMNQFDTEHSSLLVRIFGTEFSRIASHYLPAIRERIYVMTMYKGFVLELGPLLTALLLAGRIGGSYAGEIGMMQATNQNNLLKNLGRRPRLWSLGPSAIAALFAAPILTAVGSFVGLLAGGWVGVWEKYGIFPNSKEYWRAIHEHLDEYQTFLNYPPFVNIYRSLGFMLIILIVAEIAGRYRNDLQPRDVPQAITWAVVFASLLIIIADWGFSQMIHY